MHDDAAPEPERPSPAAALERAFGAVLRGPMRDVPIVTSGTPRTITAVGALATGM